MTKINYAKIMSITIHVLLVKCACQCIETIKSMVRAQTIIIKGLFHEMYEDIKLLCIANFKYYSSAVLSTNRMI